MLKILGVTCLLQITIDVMHATNLRLESEDLRESLGATELNAGCTVESRNGGHIEHRAGHNRSRSRLEYKWLVNRPAALLGVGRGRRRGQQVGRGSITATAGQDWLAASIGTIGEEQVVGEKVSMHRRRTTGCGAVRRRVGLQKIVKELIHLSS
jgi:hypothetical protein